MLRFYSRLCLNDGAGRTEDYTDADIRPPVQLFPPALTGNIPQRDVIAR